MKLFSNDNIVEQKFERGILSEIHISDIHFGKINPKVQYDILKNSFINVLYQIPIIDIIFINGDLFERKYTTDSEPILYASKFIQDIRLLAISKNATVVLLAGTESHDAGQLNLFYHYLEDPLFDIRIVENIRFEYIKGSKILCIPELYNIDEKIYQFFLYESGYYDQCVMHGTIEGAIYGNIVNSRGRLFGIDDFTNCKGPIFSGHVHVAGCYNSHFYYTGSPIRTQFNEETEKGFIIAYYNLDTREYYTKMIPIQSFKYNTILLDNININDPRELINYINNIRKEQSIDYIRLSYTDNYPIDTINLIKEYYQKDNTTKFKLINTKSNDIIEETKIDNSFNEYEYLFNDNLSAYDKLSIYINSQEKSEIITAEDIKKIMEED